jgi:hypothetical protein
MHCAECHHAESHVLNIVMLNVVMLTVVLLVKLLYLSLSISLKLDHCLLEKCFALNSLAYNKCVSELTPKFTK